MSYMCIFTCICTYMHMYMYICIDNNIYIHICEMRVFVSVCMSLSPDV